MNSRMPAARASSIAYWISGRSTSGRISFGTDLVAGRNRVPKPATGSTAFVTLLVMSPPTSPDARCALRERAACRPRSIALPL